jgi:hypothetical protein
MPSATSLMYRPQNFLSGDLPSTCMYNSALSVACFQSLFYGGGGQNTSRNEFNVACDVSVYKY